MKYTDPIIIQDNEVHSMILKKIRPKSNVLEFGAASGRMTRCLKEMLQCKISIVELEQLAYNTAISYANDGICADIEKFTWLEKWKGRQYDYILFTDVLEHLKNPREVLKKAELLLSDSGAIYISVPNIGHNDIVIKLLEERFEYTTEGLLDETHLRFFTRENLKDLVKETGLMIEEVQYKIVPMGGTEQFANSDLKLTPELKRIFLERKNGEVYQFVITLKKKQNDRQYTDYLIDSQEEYLPINCKLYFDYGNGFSENSTQTIKAVRQKKGEYKVCFDLDLEQCPLQIRLDPIEDMQCLIIKSEVYINGEMRPSEWSRCVENIKGGVILAAPDPYVIWSLPYSGTEIKVTGTFIFSIDSEYIQDCMFESLKKATHQAINREM